MIMSHEVSSKNYYTKIADSYNIISNKRTYYNTSVDNIIINQCKNKIKTIMDVGCGDGKRGINIFEKTNAEEILLIDESEEILSCVEETKHIKKISSSILDLKTEKKYDLIICLWNVLGHVETAEKRILTLKLLGELLKKNGFMFIDFNNRFNIKEYGYYSVIKNVLLNIIKKESGWYTVKNEEFATKVYVHQYYEIIKMINKSNLKINKIYFIDYKTGKLVKNMFQGQILLSLSINS